MQPGGCYYLCFTALVHAGVDRRQRAPAGRRPGSLQALQLLLDPPPPIHIHTLSLPPQGYAFVNMTISPATARLYRQFHQRRWDEQSSRKICEVTFARVQVGSSGRGKILPAGHLCASVLHVARQALSAGSASQGRDALIEHFRAAKVRRAAAGSHSHCTAAGCAC